MTSEPIYQRETITDGESRLGVAKEERVEGEDGVVKLGLADRSFYTQNG